MTTAWLLLLLLLVVSSQSVHSQPTTDDDETCAGGGLLSKLQTDVERMLVLFQTITNRFGMYQIRTTFL